MATNGLLEQNDLCATQLLNFVSNASRELKDMLGKVDRDAESPESEPVRQPSLRTPTPPFNSPVPSPTPSVVSSISDQEVPTMSPKFFSQKSQRRVRKRDFDSMSEASMVEYPSKVRRADSLGDPDEYLDFATTSMAPMGYYQHQEATYKPTPCRYGNQNSPNQYPMYSSRLQPRLQYQQDTFNNSYQYFPNQPNWPVQNTNYTQNMYTTQQHEQVPDMADLVSWMVAENFLDNESLSLLLTQC